MKKTGFLLLIFILVLGIATAYAQEAARVQINEENSEYAIYVIIPDNAVNVETTQNDFYKKTHFEFSDIPDLNINLLTAPSELFDDQNLEDLDDSDKQILIDSLSGEILNPIVETFTTEGGYEYLVVNYNLDFDTNSSSDALLLINGCFIQVEIYMDDFSALGDNWMLGKEILDSLIVQASAVE